MKNLHIFKNTNEKFSEPYIEFINNNFDKKEHFFYHIGEDRRTNKISRENIEFITKLKYFTLIKDMYKANKIILHGLMSPLLVFIFFLQPWLLKKCYWVVWGGDLYYFKNRKRNLKTNFYEFLRRSVIKNIGGIITHVKKDYELAQKWYGAKGKYYYSFMYPSNLYKEINLTDIEKKEKIYIQVGNSADPSNNHKEILEKLSKYKNENIEIICPLSYGDKEYAKKIKSLGNEIFGNKFNPLMDFLPFDEYIKILSKIDIAIFNHKRQQAMGNIITLLGLGKKVYIRDDVTTWEFFKELRITVYNNKFIELNRISDEIKFKNIKKIKEHFSEEKLKKDLDKIFGAVNLI